MSFFSYLIISVQPEGTAHGYTNLVTLRCGILGWQEHIDPSLARY